MKKKLLFLLSFLIFSSSYAQINFEPGYYINNADEKINCFIKNIDWKNNPVKFEYRLSQDSETKIGTLKLVKEFVINDVSRYIKSTVEIDRSSKILNKISSKKEPIFKKETLFLKVLVEGKANLFSYNDTNLKRYFYQKENNIIEQLVYKPYKTADDKLGENNAYKNQLWTNLKCSSFTLKTVKIIDYNTNDLVKYFIKYNECNGDTYINYQKNENENKDLFNLSFRPGINSSSLSIRNSTSNLRNVDFDNELTFRLGIEAEFILPFNKNKWSIIIEPTYQYYNSTSTTNNLTNQDVEVDYSSIELPIGLRHYFFFNENSKIFINGSFIVDISNGSEINFDSGTDLEISSTVNLGFGLGYKHNNRYSVEFRLHTNRDLLKEFISTSSDYQNFSAILGYSIF